MALQETQVKLDFFNGAILANQALFYVGSSVRARIEGRKLIAHRELLILMIFLILIQKYTKLGLAPLDELFELRVLSV